MTIKGKTLSCGANSLLPFDVNVNLNLSIVRIHVEDTFKQPLKIAGYLGVLLLKSTS